MIVAASTPIPPSTTVLDLSLRMSLALPFAWPRTFVCAWHVRAAVRMTGGLATAQCRPLLSGSGT
ncbi:hypothetical protein Shyd_04030 [Streptomyces hydrogenans]|uniref:Uncharacterized protein n=1 Tax=Streptomyces hydrogenans TaxID=1873719 RepID=A0ABQ3P1Y1_9ACTN|nr:hypothetical protein GCM10018784_64000 [Streptomyces hydrogenans]GHI19032.1 hypothetical protein Shyd_04030 [Streptomyces hydrogenans]